MFRVANDRARRVRPLLALVAAGALTLGSVAPLAASSTKNFVSNLWPAAEAMGVKRAVFDASFAGWQPSADVLELTKKQPEFSQTAGQYVTKRVSDARVDKGREMRGEWKKTLAAVAKRYGVQPEMVLAIWGMETNFGGFMGNENTIAALATLTYGGYRPDFFRKELLTALKIVSDGHVTPEKMTGSWAGAMGHTQFMPTSFMSYAADFNGDGRADIWNSIPDALASTANYLNKHGWRPGETWGYEVKLPKGFNFATAWEADKQSLGAWAELGITRANGKGFPRDGDIARLYLPAGGSGPAFLVLRNFDVIKRYNNSDSYALAVGHLADRIIGGNSFSRGWPDDTALSKDQRVQVQKLLLRKGYEIGTPDGVIGPKTRAAVIAWQSANGMLPDGYVSGRLLAALK